MISTSSRGRKTNRPFLLILPTSTLGTNVAGCLVPGRPSLLYGSAWRCGISALQQADELRVLYPSHDAPRSLFARAIPAPGDEEVWLKHKGGHHMHKENTLVHYCSALLFQHMSVFICEDNIKRNSWFVFLLCFLIVLSLVKNNISKRNQD